MLDSLTEEQKTLLAVYRDRWIAIGLSTGPCDQAAVEAGVDACYRAVGLVPPTQKIWVGSPLAAVYESNVGGRFQKYIRDLINEYGCGTITGKLTNFFRISVGKKILNVVETQLWQQIRECILYPFRMKISAQIDHQVHALFTPCYGTQDTVWLAIYAYLSDVCGVVVLPLDGFMHIAAAGGGWWWPFEDRVILSPRPTEIHRDEAGQLHHETGPAILYPDGWGVYAWHGVRVPAKVILHPDQIELSMVLTEPNLEIQRVMLERTGLIRVISSLRDREAEDKENKSCCTM